MIKVFTSSVIAIIVYTATSSAVASIDTSSWSSFYVTALHLIPIISSIVLLIAIFTTVFTVNEYTKIKMWNDFGTRLKIAYDAKFGYENKEFNTEIDLHIKAVRSLSKGYTKSLSEDWLKRMSKFVEVQYIIPEEEHLVETEKTEMIANENKLENKKNG